MTHASMTVAGLKHDSLIDVLRLIRSENVGPVTFIALARQYGSARAALEAIPALAAQGGRKKPITLFSKEDAEQEIAATHKAGGRFITIADDDYPILLRNCDDAPPVLAIFGKPVWQERKIIAMVGARNASAVGCQFARKLAQDAGANKLLVASGLARGIDTAAHTGSLATGTVAVMASGLGQVYPPENKPLHDAIAEKGCIITEQPFNALPHSRAFPGRNRIIAGMSIATIVVEAALKSGSLITARYALDYGRDVFAVPGSPLDPRCRGANLLIKQGAFVCESVEDIINNMTPLPLLQAREAASASYETSPVIRPDENEISKARDLVTGKLGYAPVAIDELLAQCHLRPDILSLILLELELAGRLQRHVGHKVALLAELAPAG